MIACVVITRGGWPNGGRRVARRASRIFEPTKVWFGRAWSQRFEPGRIRLDFSSDGSRGFPRGLRFVCDLLFGLLSGLVGLGVYQVHFRSPGGARRRGALSPLSTFKHTPKRPRRPVASRRRGLFVFRSLAFVRSIQPNSSNPSRGGLPSLQPTPSREEPGGRPATQNLQLMREGVDRDRGNEAGRDPGAN